MDFTFTERISDEEKLERIKTDLYAKNLRRIKHIEGVAECAVELKSRHFPDIPDILVLQAAYMHDFTKECTPEEHMRVFEKYGVVLDEYELATAKLYHAKSAAVLGKNVYGLSKPVCDAIYYHTTGRADMTPLDKLIYFADYIEKNRTFVSCVDVRDTYNMLLEKKHPSALDTALLYSLDLTVNELMEKGSIIHRDTFSARNFLILHGTER